MRSKWLDIGRFSLKNKANIQLSWPIMVNNGLTMKNTSRMTCLYWARCERKLAVMARARFIWQFWKMEGFDGFSLCFWHISTKVNSFLARRLTLTSLVFFFFPETKLSPCFHITAFKFLYFPVFVGNVPKIYGPRKSAPRNYFSCAVSGGLFSERKTGPRWDWVSNHNAHGHYNDNTLKKEIDLFEIEHKFYC